METTLFMDHRVISTVRDPQPHELSWMRVPEPLGEDPLIHACALAYLSDEDLLGVALLPHPSGGDWDSMMAASLDHAIWFHRPVRADEWLLFSIEGHGVANARGMGIAQVFDRDGVHVATVAQEGLGRVRRADRRAARPSGPRAPATSSSGGSARVGAHEGSGVLRDGWTRGPAVRGRPRPGVRAGRRARAGRGDQHRGRRHPQPRRRRDGDDAARRRLPVAPGRSSRSAPTSPTGAVGQRVVTTFLWGSHAELRAVPAAVTWPVPDGADSSQVACVPIAFGTADDCLFEFGHLAGRRDGARSTRPPGGVGIAAIQLAKRAGATVIATASSDERLERVRPPRHRPPRELLRARAGSTRSAAATGGAGVDLVVDSVGGRVLAGSVAVPRATAAGSSASAAPGRDPQPFDISVLGAGNHSLTGVFLGAEITNPRTRAMIADRIADVASGALEVLVDRTYPLAEAAAAHAYIESRQAVGRVVLVP